MLTWYLFVIASSACVISLIYYHWSRRHLYALAKKFKGPPTLPLIGNAHLFMCKTEDIFDKINSIFENIGKEPLRFWLGPYLLIGLKNPVYLEKIMSSSKFAYKHELYLFVETYLGDGLVSASGLNPKYKIHRRVIQPLLDLKFVESSLDIIHKHTTICIAKLQEFVDKEIFDIHTVTVKHFMDCTAEIILGHNINSQNDGLTNFCKSSIDMYDLGFNRMVKPWLHPDFIYDFLPDKAKYDNIITHLHSFIQEIIIESWVRRKLVKNEKKEFVPIVDILGEFIEQNPGIINSEDFMNHLMTLFTASFDTLTIVSSFGAMCFGMYTEYQDRAAKEIRDVIGETPKKITLEELNQMTYLDMCIKDIMRLFPIAPYILRRTLTDYPLERWIIPKKAAIVIPIFNLHRDETYWECPYHFYPDHFLPEAVKKRHVYAYLPFSAGPRGCIGKTLANIELKFFLCILLQNFEIEADGKIPNIELRSDISVRPKKGYLCRLKRRIWK